MQEGHIRFEPNINMRLTLDDGSVVVTPIVEVKNLNSFKSVRGAIEYEAQVQPKRWISDRLEHAPGTKTTRGWDQDKGCTFEQRAKEDAHDYRYFPEPDLPPVVVDDAWVEQVRLRLVETPLMRLTRWVNDYGMDRRGAMALLEEPDSCVYFDQVVDDAEQLGVSDAGAATSKVLMQVGARLSNERSIRLDELGPSTTQVAGLLKLRADNAISSAAAERLFELLCDAPNQVAAELAEREGLLTIRDDAAIDAWVDQVLAENEAIVEQIQSGKGQAIGRLIGSVMKLSGGSADAAEVKRRLLERINP
jgi:aspartyl-tRNA(Asn)/glutamyl-tRNA(Gln) amidotransferase subunit B